MNIITGWRFLDSAKINQIVQTLADSLENEANLIFLDRTEVVEADDDEIMGKFRGQIFSADIIADDQQAAIYSSGSFEFKNTVIPNIKLGMGMSQNVINKLMRLDRNYPDGSLSFFTDYQNMVAENLLKGVRQAVNALICAMQMDIGNYDRLGIKLRNVTWDMPADLKPTVATGWDNVNATPITDLQVLAQEVARDSYGEYYDRITMSSKAFRLMTQTTEFQNRAAGLVRYNFGANQLNTRDEGSMLAIAANILGMEVEIYDGTVWRQSPSGASTRERVLPFNKVILSSTATDNDRTVMDFANGIVTETLAGSITNQQVFANPSSGPVAYFTSPNSDLNPPQITAWGVARGFPRKHRESATACLTIGSF